MQLVNAQLYIDAEKAMSVPKMGITPAEVAVLQVLHGSDAVHDVEPAGEVDRSNREERDRLKTIYRQRETQNPVDALFPGRATRVFETLDELDLAEDQFKPTARVSAQSKPTKAAKASGKVGSKEAAVSAVPEDEDGVADMPNESGMFQ